MGQWYERKKAGMCTMCGAKPATSKRGILCEGCRTIVNKRNEEYNTVVEYYKKD